MDDIDTITTSEAVTLLGCSERTLRRKIRKAGIEPIVSGQAPGEQNRYDRAAIITLGGTNGHSPDMGALIVRDDTPDSLVRQVMSAIEDAKQSQQNSTAELSGHMSAIDERLARLERLLTERSEARRGFWARLFGR